MYEIMLTEKSFCPICDKPVHLLLDRNDNNPKFYICYPCNFVGQVGVGPVTPLPDKRILKTGLKMKVVSPLSAADRNQAERELGLSDES
ncbi:MAG: hypothetical protein ACE3L7_05115 [Candidatus Pristimantibacillus sp.]